MKNRMTRSASLSAIVLIAGLSLSACSSAAEPAPSTASVQAEAKPKAVVTPEAVPVVASDAAATLNSFFETIKSDANAALSSMIDSGQDMTSYAQDQNMSTFRKSFAKSYEFISMDMDQKDADKIIAAYSLIYMFTPDLRISTNESGVTIEGETAKVSGDAFEAWIGEEQQLADGNGDPGSISLKFVKGKWLITSFENTSIGETPLDQGYDPNIEEYYVEEYTE